MRYIDDLLTLNNSRGACRISIYPPELELKGTMESPVEPDLLITIDNVKYSNCGLR